MQVKSKNSSNEEKSSKVEKSNSYGSDRGILGEYSEDRPTQSQRDALERYLKSKI